MESKHLRAHTFFFVLFAFLRLRGKRTRWVQGPCLATTIRFASAAAEAFDARVQVILGDGAMVCGLPVIFESLCEKKGGGRDGQRNWFKGGRRNWKERHLRLTTRWLQYLDAPLPDGVVKGSIEVSREWTVNFNSKHANAITIECAREQMRTDFLFSHTCERCGGDDVFNVRFVSLEVRVQSWALRGRPHHPASSNAHAPLLTLCQLCRKWKEALEEAAASMSSKQLRALSSLESDGS
jgi:hypothetical protein